MLIVRSKSSGDEALSPHFRLHEFRCRCTLPTCLLTEIDSKLIDILEEIRSLFGASIAVTCGYRCAEHNEELRKKDPSVAKKSQHLLGVAADILVPDHFHKAISDRYHGKLGIGFYNNRLHVDVRKGCARWGKIPK